MGLANMGILLLIMRIFGKNNPLSPDYLSRLELDCRTRGLMIRRTATRTTTSTLTRRKRNKSIGAITLHTGCAAKLIIYYFRTIL